MRRLLACVLILLLFASCRKPETQVLPLPKLPDGPITLRVAHVVNPRLPQMTPEQIESMLTRMQQAAQEHFGVTLRFSPVDTIPIDSLFQRIPERERDRFGKSIYDFRGTTDHRPLEEIFARGLKASGEPLLEMIDYGEGYLGKLPEKSWEAFGKALSRYHLERIEQWRRIPALDGESSIDSQPYNEYMMWLALGYGKVPYELLITNQLIASIETVNPAVHSSLRGGYTNGITTYSKESRFGTLSIWSTFAFTSQDAGVKQLREGESYSAAEAARLAGLAATHEIGHQLFHFRHPYTQTTCLMSPVKMLAFGSWEKGLSAKDCPVGSSPSMRPGADRITHY